MISLNKKLIFLFLSIMVHPSCAMDEPIAKTNSIDEIIQQSALPLAHSNSIRKLIWSPDGKYIAGTSHNAPTLSVWDAKGELVWNFYKRWQFIESIAFSPDSTKIAACGTDRNDFKDFIAIFETISGKEKPFLNKFENNIRDFSYNNDGTQIAIGMTQRPSSKEVAWGLIIINADSGAVIQSFCYPDGINALTYSDDGKKLSCALLAPGGKHNSRFVVFDTTSNESLFLKHAGEQIQFLRFYHDNSSKIITCGSQKCLLWNLVTRTILRSFNNEYYLSFRDIALSSDNKKLFLAAGILGLFMDCQPKRPCVAIFCTKTGNIIASFEKESVISIALNPHVSHEDKFVVARWRNNAYMGTLANAIKYYYPPKE